MPGRFRVSDVWVLPSGPRFAVGGVITDGTVQTGMVARAADGGPFAARVAAVEFMRRAGGAEQVVLDFRPADRGEAERWMAILTSGTDLELVDDAHSATAPAV
jgi:hypothetical protein